MNYRVVDSDITGKDITDMQAKQEQILTYSESVKPGSSLRALYQPYIQSNLTPSTSSASIYDWATDDALLAEFESHTLELAIIRERGDAEILRNMGQVLSHVEHIGSRFVFGMKSLMIVIFGQQSTGKSQVVAKLINHPITYNAPGKATKCPTVYHVFHKPGAVKGEFYFAAVDNKSGKPRTEAEVKADTAAHMQNLPEITDKALHIAIYTDNPIFVGTLTDMPGFQSSIASNALPTILAEDEQVYKLLESAVASSNDESVFICSEVITKSVNKQDSSIDLMTKRFAATPQVLRELAKRLIVIVNMANNVIDPVTEAWTAQNSEEVGFHEYNRLLLEHIEALYVAGQAPKQIRAKPIMVGLNYQDAYTNYTTAAGFDAMLKSKIGDRVRYYYAQPQLPIGVDATQNYAHKIDFGSLSSLLSQIEKQRVASLQKMFVEIDAAMVQFRKVHSPQQNSSEFYKEDIFNALHSGFSRYGDMIKTYMEGYHPAGKKSAEPVFVDTSKRPQLVDYMLSTHGKSLMSTFDKAKYKIHQSTFDGTHATVSAAFQDAVSKYCATLPPQILRNGINEVESFTAEMIAAVLSISLELLDNDRVTRALRTLGVCLDNGPRQAIEKIVMEDFMAIASRLIYFFEDSLQWYFDEIIDVIFLLDRVQTRGEPGLPQPVNVLDVDISAVQFKARVRLAFRSWLHELCSGLKLEVIQGNANPITSAHAFSKAVEGLVSSLKVYEVVQETSSKHTTATASAFMNLFNILQSGVDVAKPVDIASIKQQLMQTFYTPSADFSYVFNTADFNDEYGLDYGQKFFTHLMFNLVSNVYQLLQTKVVFFADTGITSSKTLRSKLMAFIFHQVGQPELQSIDNVVDSRSREEHSYAESYYVLPSDPTRQADLLKALYRWEKKYASTAMSGEDALLKMFNRIEKQNHFLRGVLNKNR